MGRRYGIALAMLLSSAAFIAAMPAQADSFAYVSNAASNDISVFRLNGETGAMTPMGTVPFVGVDKPGSSTPLAISPDRRFLYAGVRSQPYQVQVFAIDAATGKLSHLGSGPLADSMANIVTDRSGKYLLSASYGGDKVAVNPIGPDGKVGAPQQVVATGKNAHSIQPSPDNRFAFATNLGSDRLVQFRFDAATGRLSENDPPSVTLPPKSGPRHIVFHPDARHLYLVDELDAAVAVFAYDPATGTLTERQRLPSLPADFKGEPWAADIHVTPDGRFLYISERRTSTIRSFRIDPESGLLTPLGNVATEEQPRGFAIDPTGRFLAAVGEKSDGMTVYRIDGGSGALTILARYPTGKQPNWVEFVAVK